MGIRSRKRDKKPGGPARVVIEQSPGRITGIVNLPRLTAYPAEHESSLEKSGLFQFALCHDISKIQTQPSEEHVNVPGSSRKRHYPDIKVVRDRVSPLIEIKPLAVAVSEQGLEDLLTLGKHYLQAHQPFDIFTDDQFFVEPRRRNSIRLHHYQHSRVEDDASARIYAELQRGPQTLRYLKDRLGLNSVQRDVYSLIAQRRLCIDWSLPLNDAAAISLPGHPFPGLTYDDILNSGRFRPLLQELALGVRPTDKRLLAAARAQQRPLPSPSDWAFVGGLPDGAHAGRGRTVGSLVADHGPESHPTSSAFLRSTIRDR